jgi:DNA repair exonuclease SbcCD ATPase subunit
MSRRERLENKLAKRNEWAAARARKATQKITAAVEMTKVIPMGQPILVGHHSKRGHRRLLEKSDNKMRSGIEDHDMAQHHAEKAAGLEAQLDSCIFSDDTDAVAQIEAKIAELSAERDRWKAYNASCRKGTANLDLLDAHQKADMLSIMRVTAYNVGKGGSCPAYKLTNLGANIRRYEQRLLQVKARAAQAEKAEQSEDGILITVRNGWTCVTFAEKPERSVLNALKEAGFRWRNGSWQGTGDKLPEFLRS